MTSLSTEEENKHTNRVFSLDDLQGLVIHISSGLSITWNWKRSMKMAFWVSVPYGVGRETLAEATNWRRKKRFQCLVIRTVVYSFYIFKKKIIANLWCWVSSKCTAKWLSYIHIYVYIYIYIYTFFRLFSTVAYSKILNVHFMSFIKVSQRSEC